MKKKSLLMILPIILVTLMIVGFTTPNTTFASENNYKVVFPNETNYIRLDNPTNIAVSQTKPNFAILDSTSNGKVVNIIGENKSTFNLSTADATKIQLSDNIFAYIFEGSLKLYSLSTTIDITNSFEKFLSNTLIENTNLTNDKIGNCYLTNNKIYFVKNAYDIYSVDYEANKTDVVFSNLVKFYSSKKFLFTEENLLISGNNIYFTTSGTLKKLDKTTDDVTEDILKISNKAVFDTNYVLDYSTDIISIRSFNDKTPIKINVKEKLKQNEVTDIKLLNNYLIVLDKTSKCVVVYDINDLIKGNYTEKFNYGSAGNFEDKLNNPIGTKYYLSKYYMLDSDYNTIKEFDGTNIKQYPLIDTNEDIIDFAINDNTIFYCTASKLFTLDMSDMRYDSKDITGIKGLKPFESSVLLLKDNSIVKFDREKPNDKCLNTVFTADFEVKDFAVNKNGSFVYLYDSSLNKIDKYMLDGTNTNISLNISASGITTPLIDFEVDNNGNIFVMYIENGLTNIAYMQNTPNSYVNSSKAKNTIISLNTTGNYYEIVNPVDLTIADNKLLVTDKSSNLVFEVNDTNFNYIDKSDYSKIELSGKPLKKEMTVVKTTDDILFYKYLSNLEVAEIIPSGSILWVFNEDNTNFSNKKMVLCSNEIGYIYSDKIADVAKTIDNFNAKAFSKTKLYMYPCDNENSYLFTINKDTKLKVLSKVDGFTNGNNYSWYEVEYLGNRYFAVQNNLAVDNEPDKTPNNKKINMIVKSSRVGESVNIYQDSSTDSKILTTIKDGEKVEFISENGGFTLVKYGDITGYIDSNNLIKEGLTNNQIVAIVISSITLVVALIIFVSTMIIKNKRKAKF